MITFSDLQNITSGKLLKLTENMPVKELIIDSRRSLIDPQALFFAIPGKQHDGHQYLELLYNKGIRQFIVEKENIDLPADCNILVVENSIEALQHIAAAKRSHHEVEVIGITGSNGKTMVKEWLSQLLESSYYLVKNPKSYNSQIGVPLSVWKIESHHQLGIFEAGISMPGEMEKLEEIIKPNIGIFTNIGPAHDAGFESREQKIRGKAILFKNSELVVYCKDHNQIDQVMKEFPVMLLTWGFNEEAILRLKNVEYGNSSTSFELIYKGQNLNFQIPFIDKASFENLMHCISLMLFKGFEAEFIQDHLNGLTPMSMRLEIKRGLNTSYLIDDSYSNDLSSLSVALEFMDQQQLKNKKTIILSDILQSGLEDALLYQSVAKILQSHHISRVIGIGEAISRHEKAFESFHTEFFQSTQDFLDQQDSEKFNSELILIKGARKFGFEKIAKSLQQKIHETVLEINLDALVHNLGFYRSRLGDQVKMMVMVKAVAYGSGSNEIAHILQYHNVDYLGVAYTDEAVALRNHGIHLPIMVMNPSREDFEKMVGYDLEPEIFDLGMLEDFIKHLQRSEKKARIHLKLDTGMHRLGFEINELDRLAEILNSNQEYIEVASMFSHLAGADSNDHHDFSLKQAKAFEEMSEKIMSLINSSPLRHLLNSAGILRYEQFQYDMVRLGIGLYGYEANQEEQDKLKPISTFKTNISQIREVEDGETIGYNRIGKAEGKRRIATIAVGYADGYRRSLSNGIGSVSINGQRAPIIGNICMDMSMVDVTDIEAEPGDEVILFGKDPGISELAEKTGTIPYEILTNVSDRVKRVFYSE